MQSSGPSTDTTKQPSAFPPYPSDEFEGFFRQVPEIPSPTGVNIVFGRPRTQESSTATPQQQQWSACSSKSSTRFSAPFSRVGTMLPSMQSSSPSPTPSARYRSRFRTQEHSTSGEPHFTSLPLSSALSQQQCYNSHSQFRQDCAVPSFTSSLQSSFSMQPFAPDLQMDPRMMSSLPSFSNPSMNLEQTFTEGAIVPASLSLQSNYDDFYLGFMEREGFNDDNAFPFDFDAFLWDNQLPSPHEDPLQPSAMGQYQSSEGLEPSCPDIDEFIQETGDFYEAPLSQERGSSDPNTNEADPNNGLLSAILDPFRGSLFERRMATRKERPRGGCGYDEFKIALSPSGLPRGKDMANEHCERNILGPSSFHTLNTRQGLTTPKEASEEPPILRRSPRKPKLKCEQASITNAVKSAPILGQPRQKAKTLRRGRRVGARSTSDSTLTSIATPSTSSTLSEFMDVSEDAEEDDLAPQPTKSPTRKQISVKKRLATKKRKVEIDDGGFGGSPSKKVRLTTVRGPGRPRRQAQLRPATIRSVAEQKRQEKVAEADERIRNMKAGVEAENHNAQIQLSSLAFIGLPSHHQTLSASFEKTCQPGTAAAFQVQDAGDGTFGSAGGMQNSRQVEDEYINDEDSWFMNQYEDVIFGNHVYQHIERGFYDPKSPPWQVDEKTGQPYRVWPASTDGLGYLELPVIDQGQERLSDLTAGSALAAPMSRRLPTVEVEERFRRISDVVDAASLSPLRARKDSGVDVGGEEEVAVKDWSDARRKRHEASLARDDDL